MLSPNASLAVLARSVAMLTDIKANASLLGINNRDPSLAGQYDLKLGLS